MPNSAMISDDEDDDDDDDEDDDEESNMDAYDDDVSVTSLDDLDSRVDTLESKLDDLKEEVDRIGQVVFWSAFGVLILVARLTRPEGWSVLAWGGLLVGILVVGAVIGEWKKERSFRKSIEAALKQEGERPTSRS